MDAGQQLMTVNKMQVDIEVKINMINGLSEGISIGNKHGWEKENRRDLKGLMLSLLKG